MYFQILEASVMSPPYFLCRLFLPNKKKLLSGGTIVGRKQEKEADLGERCPLLLPVMKSRECVHLINFPKSIILLVLH